MSQWAVCSPAWRFLYHVIVNCRGPIQLAIYKCGRGFELGATVKQIQDVVRAGVEPGTAGLRVRHADHTATLPPSSSFSIPNHPCSFINLSKSHQGSRLTFQLASAVARERFYSLAKTKFSLARYWIFIIASSQVNASLCSFQWTTGKYKVFAPLILTEPLSNPWNWHADKHSFLSKYRFTIFTNKIIHSTIVSTGDSPLLTLWFHLKVHLTPKYYFCLNKSLHLFETHCVFLN